MLSIKAFAKINLYLDVLSRYPDGYHKIESVMQSVALFDLIEISSSSRISLTCSNQSLESEDNLAFKAAELLKAKTGVNFGANIRITKNIPIAAGLAGGSADAAATLVGLNELWKTGLTITELQSIGFELGADVPFCCVGGTMLAQGKGELLSSQTPLVPVSIVIATLPLHVSTAEIYSNLDKLMLLPLNRKNEILQALLSKDKKVIAGLLANILENVALRQHPEIDRVKQLAIKNNCLGVLMSGSGPSVFAIFDNEEQAGDYANALSATEKNIFTNITKPVEYGVKIM
jgi:4-diphosphocytidyl-2-C-methyl-D-erythritol kinase